VTFKFQPRSQARSSLRELRARDLIFLIIYLTEFLSLSLFRGVSFLGSREFPSLEALVDVYLKTKDPIEKAKRVQQKSAAAPGFYRPGGSDRTTVRGLPTGGQTTGAKPPVLVLSNVLVLTNAPILTNVCVLKSEKTR